MDLVSIIVPVHNMDQTLERCLSSIEKQDYRHLEIIVIDDGSKDNSYGILISHQAKDPRIVVFQQPQRGVSAARNRGIMESHGNFIAFVDADDTIEPTFISKLIQTCKDTKSVIGVCNVAYIYKRHTEHPLRMPNQQILNRQEHISELLYSLKGFVANKIFTKKIIGDVRFQEGTLICEDFIFNIKVAAKVQNVGVVNEYLYNYYQDDHSATHTISTKHSLSEVAALATISKLITQESPKTQRDYNFEFAITMRHRYYDCCQAREYGIANILDAKYYSFLQQAKTAHPLTIKQYVALILHKNFYPVLNYLRKIKHSIGEI